jgi:hypothetical protein
MDESAAIQALTQKITDLQFQLNDREQEIISLRTDIAELREATSTLSIWMEKLAETLEGHDGDQG